MKPIALGLAAVLLGASGAAAAAQDPEPNPDVHPDWLKKPTANQLTAVWPTKAYAEGRGGAAVIQCTVAVSGLLVDCTVVSESPAGSGFGQAAIALTPQLLFKPALKAGKPVPSVVKIPVDFHTYGGPGPAAQVHLSKVSWLAAPSYADVIAAYPEKAAAAGVGGHATLTCEFVRGGRLASCEVLREEPRGMGFGRAASKLADRFVGPEKLADGRSTKGASTDLVFTFDPSILKGHNAVSSPAWTRLPTDEETASVVPKTLSPVRVRVVVSCTVGAQGALTDCGVSSETPADQGYGQHALAMTAYLRLAVWTEDGLPSIGGRIAAPIVFQTEASTPSPPPKP